jgi:hypothetical protein
VTQPNDEGFTVFFLLMRCSMYSLTISTWIVAVMMCVCWSYSKWIYPLSLIIFFFFCILFVCYTSSSVCKYIFFPYSVSFLFWFLSLYCVYIFEGVLPV